MPQSIQSSTRSGGARAIDGTNTTLWGTAVRAFAAHFLHRYAGMEQRAIAERVGLRTGAAISYQLKRYRELVDTDRHLRRQAERCQAELDRLVAHVSEA